MTNRQPLNSRYTHIGQDNERKQAKEKVYVITRSHIKIMVTEENARGRKKYKKQNNEIWSKTNKVAHAFLLK